MGPAVSAIICTRNRAASLARTLEAMRMLDLGGVAGFELIVVDNGSTDDTAATIGRFQATAPFPVHSILERRPGVSAAKNAALRVARHEVLICTDDDCLPAENWIQATMRIFSGDLMQVVGGRVDLHDPLHLPLSIKSSTERERLRSIYGLLGFLHGANMAFGRAVIERVGLFDVRLGPGTITGVADDAEFFYRAFQAGVPIIYDPAMVVRHDHRRIGAATWYRHVRGYARGTGGMAMRHLLAGRTDLLRMVYWDIRSAIRHWRSGGETWRWPLARLCAIDGALRFLLLASWRPPF